MYSLILLVGAEILGFVVAGCPDSLTLAVAPVAYDQFQSESSCQGCKLQISRMPMWLPGSPSRSAHIEFLSQSFILSLWLPDSKDPSASNG